ncbi:MAG: GGDEF domain-containing protein [Marinovum sp.]|nr:GGDEF domain-containing protein [Marinovum sp.]
MLYLLEAKNAAMAASRTLNQRLQGAKIAAEEQAFTDTLTGLKNRRALNLVLARLSGAKVPFTVMQLDLDYFKAVNDTYGHAAGDHVLRVAAWILVEETRAEDTVVRLGGDEFALVFYNVINATRLAKLSQRIIERLEQPVPFQNNICRISGSIGIAVFDRRSEASPEVMLEQSDQALYASKKAGWAQHSFFHCGAA